MKDLRKRLLLGLVFGFVVVLGVLFAADVRQVTEFLTSFRWQLIPLILACTLFNYLLRFYKWHYYLGLIGAGRLPWVESARLFVGGFPLAVTPGKVGEALKGVWLKEAAGVPVASGVTVVLAERISDGIAVLFLSLFGVVVYPQFWPAFLAVFLGLSLVIIISQIRPLALKILALFEHLPLLNRLTPQFFKLYESASTLFRPAPTILSVAIGMVSWLGEGIGMYLVLLGLGLPASWLTFSSAVFVLSFSTVIGAVSALPGGLGAAEASIAGLLALTLNPGRNLAAAATLLIRFFTLWFAVILGLLVWAFSKDIPVRHSDTSISE
ncbi:MAG: flippase-like domain-containing protein [Anaerolineales bacterium]|nr:flippase-like domain-containing protein [Anaerolineales bacterium]